MRAARVRRFALDGEGRARLLGVEVVHSADEDRGFIAGGQGPRLVAQPLFHRPGQTARPPDRGAEVWATKQVVQHQMPSRAARGGYKVLDGVQDFHVGGDPRILEIERASHQGFVEEPGPPAVASRGFRPDPVFNGFRPDLAEGGREDTKVERLVPKGEAQVGNGRSVGGVGSGIELESPFSIRFCTAGTADEAALRGRWGSLECQLLVQPRLAELAFERSGGAGHRMRFPFEAIRNNFA